MFLKLISTFFGGEELAGNPDSIDVVRAELITNVVSLEIAKQSHCFSPHRVSREYSVD